MGIENLAVLKSCRINGVGSSLITVIYWMTSYQIYLTNRFHVVVHLSSNRSQMMSKCGKNKKVAHEAIAECVTDVFSVFFDVFSVIYYWTDARQHGIYLFYIINIIKN